jgi:outer membrane lipoprotein-sorting protein
MITSKKILLNILVACLFVIGCTENAKEPEWIPEETAKAFLKKLEVNYTGIVCDKNGRSWATCTINIDNKIQKLECYSSSRCELINK